MRIRWRGLELPTRVEPDKSVGSDTYGKFIVEPFERGFGTTVGNSLRRILLSSLEGTAPISVKIAGVEHEFAQIEGVMEDVTDIILNLKSIIISMEADVAKELKVSKKGPGVVTAGDLIGDASIQIYNKNQVIATLTSEAEFNMELEIHKGRGFVTALENTPEEQIIGVIPIDSIYSPVTRVRYKTEDTRVGQKTNYDRLILEIWTNGTVSPEMALVEAAKILRKHLNAFVQYFEPGESLDAELPDNSVIATPPMNEALQNQLNEPISTMELSVRSFGKTSLREIKRKLQDEGLSLGMTVGAPEHAAH